MKLALLLLAVVGCTGGGSQPSASLDGGIDGGWRAPACPSDAGVNHGDWASCGTCSGALHQQDSCPDGYICSCDGHCDAWLRFPQDAGVSKCPSGWVAPACPLDAGVNHGDWAECGACSGALHQQDDCPDGYICTCGGTCGAWLQFPIDAGVCGDAGP